RPRGVAGAGCEHRKQYVAPRDELERVVCQLWQEALNVSPIGMEDDFFALGGHSILAMQVAYRLSRLLQRELSVADLFKYRTIGKLCGALKGKADLKQIPIFSGSRAPLSYAQERLWFIEQYEREASPYHIFLRFKYSPEILESIHRMVARHEVLRSRFVQDELGTYQEVFEASLLVEDVSNLQGFIQRKFDLTSDYPLRIGHYEEYLLLVIHHIAFDGWSMNVLQEELSGHEVALEIQYKDFAVWQRSEVESRWDELRGYWLEKLSGIEVLQLPTDYPRPSRIDYRGASIGFDLPLEVQAFSERHQVTPYTTCLTALGLLLSSYAGQKDLVIGTPVANRQHP
ncbi:condensation domain-containing protein, partial [Legionella oakridgensis]|uniref:condensation domain-containing protein n=1 Tax=Legionella oakridgensis TaxID=29423 RepID=UPI000564180D